MPEALRGKEGTYDDLVVVLLLESANDDNSDQGLDTLDPERETSAVCSVLEGQRRQRPKRVRPKEEIGTNGVKNRARRVGKQGRQLRSLSCRTPREKRRGRTLASSVPYLSGMPSLYLLRMLAVKWEKSVSCWDAADVDVERELTGRDSPSDDRRLLALDPALVVEVGALAARGEEVELVGRAGRDLDDDGSLRSVGRLDVLLQAR